jgi:hypothetical protein
MRPGLEVGVPLGDRAFDRGSMGCLRPWPALDAFHIRVGQFAEPTNGSSTYMSSKARAPAMVGLYGPFVLPREKHKRWEIESFKTIARVS